MAAMRCKGAATMGAIVAAALTALLTLTPSPAVASTPSFACTGNLLPTEATICSDGGLAALDRSLATLYTSKLDGLPAAQKSELEAGEKAWLTERDSCGTNKSCITNAYLVRIRQLGGVPPAPYGSGATTEQSCNESVGPTQAATYVRQCTDVSPATHPPCNASNACSLIINEIRRSCALLGASAPSFCAAYKD